MAKGMTKAAPKAFDDINDILRVTAKRAKLQTYIDEVVRCKTKILDENESIKGLRDSAVEELNIQPKMFNTLVSLFFNNNFEQKREELEQLECALDTLMQAGKDE
jgi:hypothetical protein